MTRKTTSTDLTISVRSKSRRERGRVEAAVEVREPQAREDRNAHRAPAERPPAPTERLHRRRARLALELADRRHADEDEHDRAADPDRGGHQVDDAQNGQHGRRLSSQSMSEEGILFLHLAGVLLFVGGSVAAAAAPARGDATRATLGDRPAAAVGTAGRADRARAVSSSRSLPASGSRAISGSRCRRRG